jgi:hypothetical protein
MPLDGKLVDLHGRVFGLLTVVERARLGRNRGAGNAFWRCVCACGCEVVVRGDALLSGRKRSYCHPLRHPELVLRFRPTEGHRLTRKTWRRIIERCENPNHDRYAEYGGRGIAMCQRWRESFEAFKADLGERPGPEYSIERINNERGYEPGNCRWATDAEQRLNQRRTRWVTYQGETIRLADLVARLGRVEDYQSIAGRIFVLGWSVERAVSEPVKPYPKVRGAR